MDYYALRPKVRGIKQSINQSINLYTFTVASVVQPLQGPLAGWRQ